MPPPRTVPVMTEAEQKQAESELIAARERQSGTAVKKPPPKKPQSVTKQTPAKPPADSAED
jgi:hypothetical protein